MSILADATTALRAEMPPDMAPLGPCPCCGQLALSHKIAEQGSGSLTVADLAHYADRAPARWGTIEQYKHLLPRILELTATPAALTVRSLGWSAHAHALASARLDQWPDRQHDAVLAWTRALWEGTCEGELPAWDALEALKLTTRFQPGLAKPLLEESFHDRHAIAVRRALLAEITLVDGRVEGFYEANKGRLAALDLLSATGAIDEAEAARRRVHPAEPAVRIWFCDPWRGVELSQEAAAAKRADESMWRRRMLRWKEAIKG
jgi:hypothetical protein